MNLEYWQAKAEVCRKVGIEQLMAGDIPNGTRNLKRMVRAMEEINLIRNIKVQKKLSAGVKLARQILDI